MNVDNVREFRLPSSIQEPEHKKDGKEPHFLQGIPWHADSCTLDALVHINFCIAHALPEDYTWPGEESSTDPLDKVKTAINKAIISYAQMPPERITKDDAKVLRDDVRGLLSSIGVTISRQSSLEHSDQHITPSWLVEFPFSVETKCGQCQAVEMVGGMKKHGISFFVRDSRLLRVQSLQDVLDYIVDSFNNHATKL